MKPGGAWKTRWPQWGPFDSRVLHPLNLKQARQQASGSILAQASPFSESCCGGSLLGSQWEAHQPRPPNAQFVGGAACGHSQDKPLSTMAQKGKEPLETSHIPNKSAQIASQTNQCSPRETSETG